MSSYRTAHRRVYAAKGRAADYLCVDCGATAHDWAYDGADPEELYGANGSGRPVLAYSMDPDHYAPKCRPCHLQADRAVEICAQGHEMALAGKRTHARGCAQCDRERRAEYARRPEVRDRNNARARARTPEERAHDNAQARANRRARLLRETPEEAASRKARAARKARERRAKHAAT